MFASALEDLGADLQVERLESEGSERDLGTRYPTAGTHECTESCSATTILPDTQRG